MTLKLNFGDCKEPELKQPTEMNKDYETGFAGFAMILIVVLVILAAILL
jgi:hypothetical protein